MIGGDWGQGKWDGERKHALKKISISNKVRKRGWRGGSGDMLVAGMRSKEHQITFELLIGPFLVCWLVPFSPIMI